ncbi:HNH endonuclease [Trichocoleus sp. DQ-U1]
MDLNEEEPTCQEIVNYWASREDEAGLAVDWAEAHERCWHCGYKSRLQKCHIIPKSRRGSLSVDNLVLLCRRCHREAPNSTDPRFMWIWLRATCVPFYDLFLLVRGFHEFERMFGRPPFVGLNPAILQSAEAQQIVNEELNNTIVHYGEGRRNPATLACILARVEERLSETRLEPINRLQDCMYLLPLILYTDLGKWLIEMPKT